MTQAEELLKEALYTMKSVRGVSGDLRFVDAIKSDLSCAIEDIEAYLKSQESSVKYPIGGYAPGNYRCKCVTCSKLFIGDKRAFQCEPCAIETTTKASVVESSVVNEGVISWEQAVRIVLTKHGLPEYWDLIRLYDEGYHEPLEMEMLISEAAHLFMEANRQQRWIPVEERLPEDNSQHGSVFLSEQVA